MVGHGKSDIGQRVEICTYKRNKSWGCNEQHDDCG